MISDILLGVYTGVLMISYIGSRGYIYTGVLVISYTYIGEIYSIIPARVNIMSL